MGFTKEQVQEALDRLKAGYCIAGEKPHPQIDALIFGASQFLAALPVIEQYADESLWESGSLNGGIAREHLEKLNQNNK
jgi:hypothetical protein